MSNRWTEEQKCEIKLSLNDIYELVVRNFDDDDIANLTQELAGHNRKIFDRVKDWVNEEQ